MNKKIVNFTPHTININGYGDVKSSGAVRANMNTRKIDTINGIAIFETIYSKPVLLPDRVNNTIYIVSDITCYVCPERDDFYVVSQPLKSPNRYVFGCKGLSKNPYFISSPDTNVSK